MKRKRFLVKIRLWQRLNYHLFCQDYPSAMRTCVVIDRLEVNHFHWVCNKIFYFKFKSDLMIFGDLKSKYKRYL